MLSPRAFAKNLITYINYNRITKFKNLSQEPIRNYLNSKCYLELSSIEDFDKEIHGIYWSYLSFKIIICKAEVFNYAFASDLKDFKIDNSIFYFVHDSQLLVVKEEDLQKNENELYKIVTLFTDWKDVDQQIKEELIKDSSKADYYAQETKALCLKGEKEYINTRVNETKQNILTRFISTKQNRVSELIAELARAKEALYNAQHSYAVSKLSENKDEQLANILIKNKSVKGFLVTDGFIYIITTPLTVNLTANDEFVERFVGSDEKLKDALINKENYKLFIGSYRLKIEITDATLNPRDSNLARKRACDGYNPRGNVHWDDYHCLGTFEESLNETLNSGNYSGYITIMLQYLQTLNIQDYAGQQMYQSNPLLNKNTLKLESHKYLRGVSQETLDTFDLQKYNQALNTQIRDAGYIINPNAEDTLYV